MQRKRNKEVRYGTVVEYTQSVVQRAVYSTQKIIPRQSKILLHAKRAVS